MKEERTWRLSRGWKLQRGFRDCGVCGVDGQTAEDIEAYGVERWLGELTRELRGGTYRPEAVREVLIPKKQRGKYRPGRSANDAVKRAHRLLKEGRRECIEREQRKQQRLVRDARFRLKASLGDIDYTHSRNLTKAQVSELAQGE